MAKNFIDPRQLSLDFLGKPNRRLSIFEKIKTRQLQLDPKRSKDWFIKNVRSSFMMGVTPQQLLNDDKTKLTIEAFIGKLFFFFYDPKTKETLPYYDRFPLVIPIEMTGDGFIGLNLHYLDVYNRILLLDKLLDFATDRNMDEKTRLIATWKMLKGVSRYERVYPCIKRYLGNHVRSRFVPVDAPYWEIAVALPVERFAKAKPAYAQSQSMKIFGKIRRRRQKAARG